MGFFSWMTADTAKSISNIYAEEDYGKKCHTVYLLQPNGADAIEEASYEGYGVFGGVDAYAWLAVANGVASETDTEDEQRTKGIELAFSGEDYNYPLKFSFNKSAVYEDLPASADCPNQGFFY